MRTLLITLLLGFISISVFGLLLMPYDGSDHDSDCLASFINNRASPCPDEDPLGFASFHNNAVKKIVNLTVLSTTTIQYMMVLALVYFISSVFGLGRLLLFELKVPAVLALKSEEKNFSKFLTWISLHEKRDPMPLI